MTFKIEKNIPFAEVPRKTIKYPFAEMAVGDSFAFTLKQKRKVQSALCTYERRHEGTRFAIAGLRCWRLK